MNTGKEDLSQHLQSLKAKAYDCHRQITLLTQVELPRIEREIAEVERAVTDQ